LDVTKHAARVCLCDIQPTAFVLGASALTANSYYCGWWMQDDMHLGHVVRYDTNWLEDSKASSKC